MAKQAHSNCKTINSMQHPQNLLPNDDQQIYGSIFAFLGHYKYNFQNFVLFSLQLLVGGEEKKKERKKLYLDHDMQRL